MSHKHVCVCVCLRLPNTDLEYQQSLAEDRLKDLELSKQKELEEIGKGGIWQGNKEERDVEEGVGGRGSDKKEEVATEPEEGEGVVMLRLRLPAGDQMSRRFRISDSLLVILCVT